MRKFGRPDLSIHNVDSEFDTIVVKLFHRFIEYQAHGAMACTAGSQIEIGSIGEINIDFTTVVTSCYNSADGVLLIDSSTTRLQFSLDNMS